MKKVIGILITAAIILSGCDKNKSNSASNGPGRLSVTITDDPFDINYVESATVTITKIEVRKSGENDGNPFMVVSETPVTVNLVVLRNGLTQELANIEVPAGDYDLVRLYIDEASLLIKDRTEAFNLKVPSGKQTGLKVFVNPVLHVEGGLTTELMLDFDLSRSFVMRGNMRNSAGVNGFIFKPCIRAVNNSFAGRIEGYVRDTLDIPIPDATVWVKQDTVFSTTFSDTDGHYILSGIPAGTYTLSATQDGYDTVMAEGITVVAANKVIHDITLRIPLYFVGAVVESADPGKIVLTFSRTLASIVPGVSSFTVNVNNVQATINSVIIDADTVVLTLSVPIEAGDVVTVAYTGSDTDPLQTYGGYEAPSFPASDVTNNVSN